MTESVAKVTRNFILSNPSIAYCLQRGLINLSALAREISVSTKSKNEVAILAASRRFAGRLEKRFGASDRVASILRDAHVLVVNRMAVVVIETPRDLEPIYLLERKIRKVRGEFNMVRGIDVITIIMPERFVPELEQFYSGKIRKKNLGVVQVTVVFDERMETTPGVVAHIYGILSLHGINVIEEMSCWTDLKLVLSATDLPRALDVLNF